MISVNISHTGISDSPPQCDFALLQYCIKGGFCPKDTVSSSTPVMGAGRSRLSRMGCTMDLMWSCSFSSTLRYLMGREGVRKKKKLWRLENNKQPKKAPEWFLVLLITEHWSPTVSVETVGYVTCQCLIKKLIHSTDSLSVPVSDAFLAAWSDTLCNRDIMWD